jgi:uncharacterized protein (DUF58 family)
MSAWAPSRRLLAALALAGGPLALAATQWPDAADALPWAIALVAAAALVDAARPVAGLEALQVKPGALLRLLRGRPGTLRLTLEKPGLAATAGLTLRLGLDLPALVACDAPIQALRLGPGPGPFAADWSLTPQRRGHLPLAWLHAEAPSPWGLWLRRRRLPLDAALRVAPSLGHERRGLAHFLLRRGSGVRQLRVSGQGREFDQLREYAPGDPYSDIDWKATARRGKPVTRVHQVERTQELTVLLDASRLSARPSALGGPGETLLESHLRACLALQLACASQGDRFGLVVFAGKVLHQLAPASGGASQRAVSDVLAKLRSTDESPDHLELAAQVGAWRRRRGLLVLLACLDDPLAAEQCVQGCASLARRHVVLAVSARSHGAEPAFSRPLGPGEDLADALAAQWRYQGVQRLGRSLRALGAHLAWVPEDRLAQEAVSLYVRARERQWV